MLVSHMSNANADRSKRAVERKRPLRNLSCTSGKQGFDVSIDLDVYFFFLTSGGTSDCFSENNDVLLLWLSVISNPKWLNFDKIIRFSQIGWHLDILFLIFELRN